jgi:hypothetical protein
VHTTDSIWAFELKSRAEEIRTRLGEHAPPRLAFAPGPVPEPLAATAETAAKAPVEPAADHVAKADSLVRVIRDEELRKVVAKAIAFGLANAD